MKQNIFILPGILVFILAACNNSTNPVDSAAQVFIDSPYAGRLMRINSGSFTIGSPENEPGRNSDEGPQHRVTLNAFYMGRYQVTQAQYKAVMGTNPGAFAFAVNAGDLPVERVSWYDAVEFCNKLSELEGLTPYYTIDKTIDDPNNFSDKDSVKWDVSFNPLANGYRLPTEAQWEYACRAGTITAFNWGTNQISTSRANFYGRGSLYNGSPAGIYRNTTTAVGSFAPNAWGLYDMHGNVYEWCWDWEWWDENNYSEFPTTNPDGPNYGANRVIRGGSWFCEGSELRSAYRHSAFASDRRSVIGFRVVRR